MDERYVAGLYKAIELFDNIYAFRLEGLIENGKINPLDKKQKMVFTHDNSRKAVLPLESGFNFDTNYYYDNYIPYEDLCKRYPDAKSEQELLYTYLDEIHKDVLLGYYDEEKEQLKVVTTNDHFLKKCNLENLTSSFFAISLEEPNMVNLPVNNITSMLTLIKQKDYETVEQYLKRMFDDINMVYQENNIELLKLEELKEHKEMTNNLDELYKVIEESMSELNELIGMDDIKEEISKFAKLLILKHKTKEYLKLDDINMNMVFTGNPGTGKTTVARIIGKLLYNLGYSKKEKIAEITAKDLIGEYVGQTSIKTTELINEYKGGIIFLDEAYALSNDGNPYASDALVEIIKELEKRRTIFIFAGYTEEMRQFIEMNSGISSRIGYNLEYQDYSAEELLKIFELKATKRGFNLEEELKDKLITIFDKERQENHFGNGRFADNLLDKIIFEHSVHTEFETDKDILTKLTINDLETVKLENNKAKVKKIGFM